MNIGIMGGTFDPPHAGHLIAAEQARDQAGLDQVWFMPAHTPPHKERAPGASSEQRLEMIQAAIRDHSSFSICTLELKRGGKSYTLDTINLLNKQFPTDHFYWIIGSDMVYTLTEWHEIQQLVRKVRFIGLHRAGFEYLQRELPEWIEEVVQWVEMPEINISSTAIRQFVKEGRSIRYLVPDHVKTLIEENRLYYES